MTPPPYAPRSARSVLAEATVVLLGVEAVTLAAVLLPRVWPGATPYQGVIIALAFLYAPVLADRWARERPPPIPRGAAWRSLCVGLLTAVIVLPPFAIGNHLFQRHVHGREVLPGSWTERMKGWPVEWEGRPARLDGKLPRIWVDAGLLVVANPQAAPSTARVDWIPAPGTAPARLASLAGGEPREVGDVARRPLDLPPGSAVVFRSRGVEALTVDGFSEISAGATSARRDAPREQAPGWIWWIWILASQVILIALPEEVFYRGYLQTRLRRIWPGGVPVLGVAVGPAILVTSALFALGHVVTIPAAFRLAVFFPSLLFGWLRDRTDHLAGPVVFHVLSNLAMLTVMRFYG